jgi:hypothetical protein
LCLFVPAGREKNGGGGAHPKICFIFRVEDISYLLDIQGGKHPISIGYSGWKIQICWIFRVRNAECYGNPEE